MSEPGRPTLFSAELAEQICERLSLGESLPAICTGHGMPARSTVFRWVATRPEFRDQYVCAREAQAESLIDEVLDVARASNGATAHADRVRIDAVKWLAAKLAPKRYGDRAALELAGDLTIGAADHDALAARIESGLAELDRRDPAGARELRVSR